MWEKIHWGVFRTFEKLGGLRGRQSPGRPALPSQAKPEQALWIFVSTIGELNAIATLTARLKENFPVLRLVLITDHEHYREPYLARHPDAVVYCTQGASDDAAHLAGHYPPKMLVIGEIPCLPSDAPCRFSYAFIRQAKKCGAVVALVNGWLYGQSPSCKMDSVERSLLTRDYLRIMDLLCVQTEQVRDMLTRYGAPLQNLHVTGNMKFDAVTREEWRQEHTRSPRILKHLVDGTRPVVVVGCIRYQSEQTLVIKAFKQLLTDAPDALMVFAHRHPEIPENLDSLSSELESAGILHDLRSKLGDVPPDDGLHCLVLDTMGELRDFYAVATVAHVGADHNVLEPLAYRKPVTVVSDWHPGYPNHPIFVALLAKGVLRPADSQDQLATSWTDWVKHDQTRHDHLLELDKMLSQMKGATEKSFRLISLAMGR